MGAAATVEVVVFEAKWAGRKSMVQNVQGFGSCPRATGTRLHQQLGCTDGAGRSLASHSNGCMDSGHAAHCVQACRASRSVSALPHDMALVQVSLAVILAARRHTSLAGIVRAVACTVQIRCLHNGFLRCLRGENGEDFLNPEKQLFIIEVLTSIALDLSTDTSHVETQHSAFRRRIFGRSAHCRRPLFSKVAMEWIVQCGVNCRDRIVGVRPDLPPRAQRRRDKIFRDTGGCRAYVSARMRQDGLSWSDMTQILQEWRGMDVAARQEYVQNGVVGSHRRRNGASAFGSSRQREVERRDKLRRIEQGVNEVLEGARFGEPLPPAPPHRHDHDAVGVPMAVALQAPHFDTEVQRRARIALDNAEAQEIQAYHNERRSTNELSEVLKDVAPKCLASELGEVVPCSLNTVEFFPRYQVDAATSALVTESKVSKTAAHVCRSFAREWARRTQEVARHEAPPIREDGARPGSCWKECWPCCLCSAEGPGRRLKQARHAFHQRMKALFPRGSARRPLLAEGHTNNNRKNHILVRGGLTCLTLSLTSPADATGSIS